MAVLQCRIRKIRLPNLAEDESSDHDSVNCSEISAVTWFGIFSGFLKIETFVFFTPPYYLQLGLIALLFGSFCHHHWRIYNLCFAAPLHAQIST